MRPNWRGVFPAITTQFHDDQSLNLEGTARHLEILIEAGIHGVVLLGTVGENTALESEEKLAVVRELVATARGRIPVLAGVAEYTTALGCRFARDAEKLGADGLMVLPAMVYKSDERETLAHFRAVARATGLPIMIYNNPVSYGVDMPPEAFAQLADVANIVAIKESSENVRRITDLINLSGRPLHPVRRRGRPGAGKRAAGRAGLGFRPGQRVPRREPRAVGPGHARPLASRRANCTAGTRRCCTWIPR